MHLILVGTRGSKYFAALKNRFLLFKCITMGAFSFPTPFLICFFLGGINAGDFSPDTRFLIIVLLLLSGSVIGLASYYKDAAISVLKDWYPSKRS